MKNKKLSKQRLRILLIDVIVTAVFGLLVALVPESYMGLSGKMALVSANIVIAIAVMQYSLTSNFEKITDDAKENADKLLSVLNELNIQIEAEETVKKALEADVNLRQFILPIFESNNKQIKKYLAEKRTGALASHVYYNELLKLAEKISAEKKEKKNAFTGEIWAQSSLLENELDVNDNFEAVWLKKMRELDMQKISTRRLYIVKPKDIELLKKDELTSDILTQLKKLLPYCIKNSEFVNTTSKAIAQSRIDKSSEELLGPGFFAVTFSDNVSTMIRDVSIDNQQSTTLGGEVDFNTERVSRAKNCWDNYMSLALPLKQFLWENCSEIVKAKMAEMDFDK